VTAPFATAGPSAYWYLARGTGIVSLLLLTASVMLGILGSVRFAAAPRWPRFAIDTLHRDISLLGIAFLVVHIVTSVLDSFAPIALADAVVPFVSAYRPLWIGLGAVAFDLLVAIAITSLVRRRLGYATWRAVHWLAYASWPVAVLHGLGTGSDIDQWWNLAITAACCLAVLAAIWIRLVRSGPAAEPFRAPAIGLTMLSAAGLAIFTLAGPLQRGWARRAGTPPSLLPRSSVPVSSHISASSLKLPFSATLAGRVTQTPAAGGELVDLLLHLHGGPRGELRARLAGAPLDTGGLSMTGSQVDLLLGGVPSLLEGQIVSLQGDQFVARVADGSGLVLDLHANLSIDSQTGGVTGTLQGASAGAGG
jgi:sulfoxide reductase heme-binding subunit YedZ